MKSNYLNKCLIKFVKQRIKQNLNLMNMRSASNYFDYTLMD